jgi:hypothetical protein
MLSRAERICTIGYDGPAAVVDGYAAKQYGKLSTAELAERGLFRAAYASAIWSGKTEELETVVAAYNKMTGAALTADSPLDRLFGVFPVDVKRSVVL